MERVAFLIESTGQRIGCMLNPASLVTRRLSGVRPRQLAGGKLTGAALRDDPLLVSGGGRTELTLDLLFDVRLAGSSIASEDVRDLTQPLWALSEGERADRSAPPLVSFVWGKAWNVPGVIEAISERLERFSPSGVPGRSWLRMRLLRVEPASLRDNGPGGLAGATSPGAPAVPGGAAAIPPEVLRQSVAQLEPIAPGGPDSDGSEADRLDVLAYRYLGDASRWRELADRVRPASAASPGREAREPAQNERGLDRDREESA